MKSISEYDDIASVQQIMKNAKRLGRDEIYWEAFRRVCELEGQQYEDDLHRDFYSTLKAYEELLTEKNGKTTKASRTRQKLARLGVIQCLEDWASDSKETPGFTLLVANGLIHLTAEFLVLKYRDQFSDKAITSATKRLNAVEMREAFEAEFKKAGIKLDSP